MQSEKEGYIFEELGCTVSEEESEQAEKELKLLVFEKNILEDILSSIQNESSRSIDPADRERIYKKYENQLRSIEEHMNRYRLVVKLRKLEVGRMKLLGMLKDRLEYIDREIRELRSTLGKQKREAREAKPKLETVDSKQSRSRTVEPREADRIEAIEQIEEKDELQKLQEDVMAALEKLEQLDLEL